MDATEDGIADVITMTKAQFLELIGYRNELMALHAGGVDNWDFYYESLRDAGLLDDWDEEGDN